MDKKLDELLYESLKPANEPEPELNRRILDRRARNNMRKLNVRKTVAAAVVGVLVAAGGVSVYAATQNHSLLSLFQGEGREVKERAEELLDTQVSQKTEDNQKQSQWANFKIKEAIVDKNQVNIQVEVKAADPDKYLLVPYYLETNESVEDLHMDGLTGEQSIGDYAKSIGKECLFVDAGIEVKSSTPMEDTPISFGSSVQSIDNHMEKDGTLLFDIKFGNDKKSQNLEYVCETFVYLDLENRENMLKDKISFTLNDKSNREVLKYLPVSQGKVPGTDLVIDEVTFEKSDLEAVCNVTYHYAGKSKNWEETKDFDICFFLMDSQGKVIESGEGGSGTMPDGLKRVQSWQYSLKNLPDSILGNGKDTQDTITFQAKDVMEKKVYGTVDVKLAE